MTLPNVREYNNAWYVTKDGMVFNANGYAYNGKTYYDAKHYEGNEQPSTAGNNAGRAPSIYAKIQNPADTTITVPSDGRVTYTVTFYDTESSSTISTQTVAENDSVAQPTDPSKENYIFAGWYSDSGLTTTYDFTKPITGAMTIYAKWNQAVAALSTLNGTPITLNSTTFGQYLGKRVTNFKDTSDATETVTPAGKTVSTQYRLFWIDYAGTYGDKGTIYLKADFPGLSYKSVCSDSQATDVSIITKFNKQIGTSDVTAKSENSNMKAVTWLLDDNNWTSITTTNIHSDMAGKTIKAYGAVPLEMFIESYNKHYNLTGYSLVAGDITEGGARKKLFSSYTSGANGYQVGPGRSAAYESSTARYTVQADLSSESRVGSTYYPGESTVAGSPYPGYWLASPSAYSTSGVMYVTSRYGGFVRYDDYNSYLAFCPLVSLPSDVVLKLAD